MTRGRRAISLVRCCGCGKIFRNDHGTYVRSDGSSGNISSHGRNCEHDWCDECDAAGACRRCGAPDQV